MHKLLTGVPRHLRRYSALQHVQHLPQRARLRVLPHQHLRKLLPERSHVVCRIRSYRRQFRRRCRPWRRRRGCRYRRRSCNGSCRLRLLLDDRPMMTYSGNKSRLLLNNIFTTQMLYCMFLHSHVGFFKYPICFLCRKF